MSPPTARVDRRSPHPRLCASSARRVLGARHHHEKVAGFVLRRPAPCRSSSPRPRPTRTAIRMADMLTLGDSRSKVLRDSRLKVLRDSRCKVLRDSRLKVLRDSRLKVLRDSRLKVLGDHAAKFFATAPQGVLGGL